MKKIIVLVVLILITSGCNSLQKTAPQTSCYCPSCKDECRKQCDGEIAKAQEPQKHEIDLAEEKCLKKAYSNADMMNCGNEAMDAWFLEIDENLKTLKKILPPEKYALILNSQTEWKKYQKTEFKAESELMFNKGGTFYYTYAIAEGIGVIKERALLLYSYISIYSEQY